MKDLLWSIVDDFTVRMGSEYSFLKSSQWWDLKRLRDYQLQKLKKVCAAFGEKVETWVDFESLPLTTKEDLRKWKPKAGKYHIHRTSGSTGYPVEICLPRSGLGRKEATFMRAWDWAGRRDGWVVRFMSGEPTIKRYDWLRNVKPMNFRDIKEEDLDWIVRHKPELIHCTVFTARELIWRLKKRKQEGVLKDSILFWVGEDTAPHKEEVSKYFKDIFEGYGLAELPTIAAECEYHKMHIIMEAGVIEEVDGEIVMTDFNNFVTPLIRYRTGDHGALSYEHCKCGRQSPILEDLRGRRVDYYDGPEVRRPIDWLIVSPISKKCLGYIQSFRAEVRPKERLFILKVIWGGEPDPGKLSWYKEWVEKETGLRFRLRTMKRPFNDKYIVRVV